MMKVNRHEVIKEILVHQFQQDFYVFIDFINIHNTANEFPSTLYLQFYEKVRAKNDAALLNIFSLDVLVNNGFFAYIDKNTGRIAMSEGAYNFFAFIDVTRSRQLDHIEFESLRQDVQSTVAIIISAPKQSDDYQEAVNYFQAIIARVISAIKANLDVLHHRVGEISELYQQKEQGLATISINELFEKAQKLYDRNIQPCLDFIDSNRQMKETDTFTVSMTKLYRHYKSEAMEEAANMIQYKGTAVTSYYKDIDQLAERLRQYLLNLAEDRKYFMVIERAFDHLIDSFKPLRHGRKYNRFLHSESEIITLLTSLDGLSSFRHSYSACFNRDPDKVMLQFKIFHLDLQQRSTAKPTKLLQPITNMTETLAFDRMNQIFKLVSAVTLPDDMPDIYQYVYGYLEDQLDDMTLLDCLYGLSCLFSLMNSACIVQGDERNRLEDDQYYLDYLIMEYHKGDTKYDG